MSSTLSIHQPTIHQPSSILSNLVESSFAVPYLGSLLQLTTPTAARPYHTKTRASRVQFTTTTMTAPRTRDTHTHTHKAARWPVQAVLEVLLEPAHCFSCRFGAVRECAWCRTECRMPPINIDCQMRANKKLFCSSQRQMAQHSHSSVQHTAAIRAASGRTWTELPPRTSVVCWAWPVSGQFTLDGMHHFGGVCCDASNTEKHTGTGL
ncbi:hypothetical protein B0H66DRAFT_107332 [Apodospora peruviana]|uniref:Uncharacterized protein n=1 Tax=Apodospora peruviana TaxID=516989 RepID=A0AAE0MBG5_9PEZI|nr:hypothetical protein B0H66DRAFT_107332 [Apodospora peruviana]